MANAGLLGVLPKGLLVPEGVLKKRDEQVQGGSLGISNRRNPVSFASVAPLQGAEVIWKLVPRVSATASRPPQPCALACTSHKGAAETPVGVLGASICSDWLSGCPKDYLFPKEL